MNHSEKLDEENKKHIQKTYTDKAMKLLKICIGLSIFSILTYFIAIFFYQLFDFGLIFETISFVFMVMAWYKITNHNLQAGKRNVIIAMLPIGWLMIYDLINLLANIQEVMYEVIGYYTSLDQYFYYLEPYLYDVVLVALIVLLYAVYHALTKADGSKKADDYVESFYDKL